jgi:hypothetical protein
MLASGTVALKSVLPVQQISRGVRLGPELGLDEKRYPFIMPARMTE